MAAGLWRIPRLLPRAHGVCSLTPFPPPSFLLPPQSTTIILLQTNPSAQSRTYLDFDTKAKAMDAVVKMYEDRLKEITPGARNITYDVQDLFRYIDNITDISALV